MKKYIVSIVLCLVLIGALGGLYVLSRSNQEDPVPTESANTQISLLNKTKNDVTQLTITREDDEVTYNRAEDGKWSMSDVDAPVENAMVTDITNNICTLYALEIVDDAVEDLAGYGLAPAVATLRVTFADGSTETVRLGARTAARDFYYMMVEGDSSLYLISNTSGARFNRTREDMLNRTMLSVQADAIQHVVIKNKGEEILEAYADLSLYDPETGIHQLVTMKPVVGRKVFPNMFQAMVADVLGAVTLGNCIASITPESLTQYGFDTPLFEIVMENMDASYHLTVGRTFGEENDKAYAIYGDIPYIFEISAVPIKEVVTLTAFDFMEKIVSYFVVDDVAQIKLDSDTLDRHYVIDLAHEHVDAVGLQVAEHNIITAQVDGQYVPERAFRDTYVALILITYDSTIPSFAPSGEPAVTVAFTMNNGEPGVVDKYYDYDSHFYAIDKGTAGCFLVNKAYVQAVLDAVDKLKAGE